MVQSVHLSLPFSHLCFFLLLFLSARPLPQLTTLAGNLLKGACDDSGKLKDAALMVGIKLDLEAEVHLTARVRGDILIGLY